MDPPEYAKMARFEDDHWWYRSLHARVLHAVAEHAPGFRSLLDAGCGTGGLLRRLHDLHPSARLAGVDVSADAVEFCRRRNLRSVSRGSLDDIGFRAGVFDVVTSQDVLCHRRVDKARAVAELHRVLCPGGVLILNLPAFDLLRSSHDRLVDNEHRFRRAEVAGWLERSGFEVVSAGYWNALLFPVVAGVRLVRRRQAATESDVRPVAPRWNRLLVRLLAAELAWLGKAPLPFGTSVFCVARKSTP